MVLVAQVRDVRISHIDNFMSKTGLGLECLVGNRRVLLGNREWLQQNSLVLSRAQDEQVRDGLGLGFGSDWSRGRVAPSVRASRLDLT